jgi:hypothetical protein
MSDFHSQMHDEIVVQGEAIKECCRHSECTCMQMIEEYGSEMRDIIEAFKEDIGRLPTKDDLLFCLGIAIKDDPRHMYDS